MKIAAVCIGSPETLPGKSYKTGIFKTPLSGPVQIDEMGLLGDAICNKKHHGGIDQAIYIEGGETLKWWEAELGHPLSPGTFGENLVIDAIDNRDIAVGDRFTAGGVILEATSARIPCATFAAKMNDRMFVKRYAKAARPGIYCRVIAGGIIQAGMAVAYTPYSGERVTMPELLRTFGQRLTGKDLERQLSTPLSDRLRAMLTA